MRVQWWMRATLVAGLLVGCGGSSRLASAEPKPPIELAGGSAPESTVPEPTADEQCGGKPLRVAFYDAGQALAALVTLPDGRKILVEAGESPTRAGCGAPGKAWHSRVLAGLTKDVGDGGRIDMVWNTHPHSDHLGGMPGVATNFEIGAYVHNRRDTDGHYGSDTSSTAEFLTALKPTYAVISSGKQGDGINKTYCHPIRSTLDALNVPMGRVGAGARTPRSLDGAASGVKCNKSKPSHGVDAPAHDNIWSTSRDGSVVPTTIRDRKFTAELGQ